MNQVERELEKEAQSLVQDNHAEDGEGRYGSGDYDRGVADMMDSAKAIVAAANEWISVNDELPPKDTKVDIVYQTKGGKQCCITGKYVGKKFIFYTGLKHLRQAGVKYWKFRPTPPTEGSE